MFEYIKDWASMPPQAQKNILIALIVLGLAYHIRNLELKIKEKVVKIEMLEERNSNDREGYINSLERERDRAMDVHWRSIEMKKQVENVEN